MFAQQQQPSGGTSTSEVPSGNSTGIFYIAFSNVGPKPQLSTPDASSRNQELI